MPEVKQDIGLSILTSSAVFGAWSAWNSSLFTAATFVDNQEKYQNAKLAMDLGLATAAATGIGVYYVYGQKGKVAAISAGLTGVVLYLAYYFKLRCNPNVSPYMMGGNGNGNNTNKNNNNSLYKWRPLSEEEMYRLRITMNQSSNPVEFVNEP